MSKRSVQKQRESLLAADENIDPPKDLMTTAEAEQIYRQIAQSMPNDERRRPSVITVIAEAAEALATARRCNRAIVEHGEIYTTPDGLLKANPACAIAHQAATRYAALLSRLKSPLPTGDLRENARQAKYEQSLSITRNRNKDDDRWLLA